MASRRAFLLAAVLGAVGARHAAAQGRRYRFGVLTASASAPALAALRRRLGELGFTEAAGAVFDVRSAENLTEVFPLLARELAARKHDLYFAVGPADAAHALRDARVQAPIVLVAEYNPVDKGLAETMERPGGNLTGVYVPQFGLATKRIEIARELVPGATRFVALADMYCGDELRAMRKAAKGMLTVLNFSRYPYEFADGFEASDRAQAQVLFGLSSPVFIQHRAMLSDLVRARRLTAVVAPAMVSADTAFVIGFGPHTTRLGGRAAEMAVDIVNGRRVAEVRVEQIAEYELVVNLRAAKALGVNVPPALLARASQVIS